MTQVTDEASLVCWHPFSSLDDMCPSDTDRASRICGHISGDSIPLYLLLESADGTSASAAAAGQWICDGLTLLSRTAQALHARVFSFGAVTLALSPKMRKAVSMCPASVAVHTRPRQTYVSCVHWPYLRRAPGPYQITPNSPCLCAMG